MTLMTLTALDLLRQRVWTLSGGAACIPQGSQAFQVWQTGLKALFAQAIQRGEPLPLLVGCPMLILSGRSRFLVQRPLPQE